MPHLKQGIQKVSYSLKVNWFKGRSPQAREEVGNEMISELTIMSVIVSPVGFMPGTAASLTGVFVMIVVSDLNVHGPSPRHVCVP